MPAQILRRQSAWTNASTTRRRLEATANSSEPQLVAAVRISFRASSILADHPGGACLCRACHSCAHSQHAVTLLTWTSMDEHQAPPNVEENLAAAAEEPEKEKQGGVISCLRSERQSLLRRTIDPAAEAALVIGWSEPEGRCGSTKGPKTEGGGSTGGCLAGRPGRSLLLLG
ncbi:hypothetical protein Esti_000989 [Eimeria stiedai]